MSASLSFQAEWVQLNPSSRVNPRRSGLVSFRSTTEGTPYIFGGYAEEDIVADDDKDKATKKKESASPYISSKYHRYVKNDLWKWNVQNNEWQKVPHKGDIPVGRLAAAAAVMDATNKAYLVGGWNSDAEQTGGDMFLDTVHEYDLTTETWRKMSAVIPDGPSSRHIALALPKLGKLLLHNHRCDNFVWLLDPAKDCFVKQSTTGPCPSSRGLHAGALLLLDDNDAAAERCVIFGGAAQDGTMSNEAFLLDTSTWTWSAVVTGGNNKDDNNRPSPRASPCMCAVDENHVIVFGGAESTGSGLNARGDVWLLSLQSQEWKLLIPDADSEENNSDGTGSSLVRPPPRNGAALIPLGSSSKERTKEFLLTGGWAPFQETWDDCFVLRVTPKDP